jgi:hypothetical protein
MPPKKALKNVEKSPEKQTAQPVPDEEEKNLIWEDDPVEVETDKKSGEEFESHETDSDPRIGLLNDELFDISQQIAKETDFWPPKLSQGHQFLEQRRLFLEFINLD